ncbi:hypothetical protein EHS39_23345 [Ensifer sp. MPMI2T]|nr:hypothetical protein EHS39_23345 [Ensifer sp. MPMI2T]
MARASCAARIFGVAAALAATEGLGVNVVLDMVGGSYVDRNLRAMAEDGRYALISLQPARWLLPISSR